MKAVSANHSADTQNCSAGLRTNPRISTPRATNTKNSAAVNLASTKSRTKALAGPWSRAGSRFSSPASSAAREALRSARSRSRMALRAALGSAGTFSACRRAASRLLAGRGGPALGTLARGQCAAALGARGLGRTRGRGVGGGRVAASEHGGLTLTASGLGGSPGAHAPTAP